MPTPDYTIRVSTTLAIEQAFVALLRGSTDLGDTEAIDIVAASDRDALVGPLHCFVLCTEFLPLIACNPNGKATVAIALVTDLDDHGSEARQLWLERIVSALTTATQPAPDAETGCQLTDWSIASMKDQSEGRKVMDVISLRVAACSN